MNAYRAKPNHIPWPPIITVAAIIMSVLLGLVLAPALPGAPPVRLLGIALIGGAVWLEVWAAVTLINAHTTVLPHRKSSHLVSTGPYNLSRNPIYLGNVLLLLGLGLITTNGWFLVFAAATGFATNALAIRREELHLLACFGAEYEYYCRRVRRWI
jgi:protein-S-isoprenylcysteine O-methyltransferase Ste14